MTRNVKYRPGGKGVDAFRGNTAGALSRYRDGKFLIPPLFKPPAPTKLPSMMWQFLFGGEQRTPGRRLKAVVVPPVRWEPPDDGRLDATWLGHSSMLVNIDGFKILTDPIFQKRLTPIGPSRMSGFPPFDLRHIGHMDIVLISHNHYDHLNKFTIRYLADRAERFIVPLYNGALLASWGVPSGKIVELNWWEEFRYKDKLMVAATPAQHFSGRGLTDRNESLWASYVMEGPQHKVYFSGDSGYFDGLEKIGDTYGPFDMTFIECGAYNEIWHEVHMFPEETVQAHLDLKGNVLHPIHWGTYNLAMHSWHEPMRRLVEAATAAGVPVSTPVVGETTVFDGDLKQFRWWEATPPGGI